MDLRPGDKLGRYVVEALLGRGGMGSVYRARDSELGRLVALKVISGVPDENALLRFKREARAACAFSHPNAATVYDVGSVDERPYLVMELLDGDTLRSRMAEDGVTVADKRRWLLEIARALEAAHLAGLVHRDVKPDNVIITKGGTAKLVDFGIARDSNEPVDPSAPTSDATLANMTETGSIVGSPAYMSPEQLRGGTLDGRTDQFSWGVMAYEALQGQLPWGEKTSAFEVAAAILNEQAAPLASPAHADPALGAAVMQCLARKPSDRLPSMTELCRALEAESTGSAVRVAAVADAREAVPTSTETHANRRAPWALGLVGAIVAGGALIIYLARRDPEQPTSSANVPTATSAPTAPGSTDTPSGSAPSANGVLISPTIELRHCKAEGCSKDNDAWCTPTGERKACCATGLMGTAAGRCTCPPGGSRVKKLVDLGCTAADAEHATKLQRHVRTHFRQARDCYEKAQLRNMKLMATLATRFELTPSGVPYGVELIGVDVPDPEFQDCVVTFFSNLRFEPPGDGHTAIVYPIVFSDPQ